MYFISVNSEMDTLELILELISVELNGIKLEKELLDLLLEDENLDSAQKLNLINTWLNKYNKIVKQTAEKLTEVENNLDEDQYEERSRLNDLRKKLQI